MSNNFRLNQKLLKEILLAWQKTCVVYCCMILLVTETSAQLLTLKNATETALTNYGTIKSKANYLRASQASAKGTAYEYLPNLSLAAQQAYGTANGQFGPLFASGGLNAGSSGPAFASQNWHAA